MFTVQLENVPDPVVEEMETTSAPVVELYDETTPDI
jgi:hypothetical protein